MSFKSSYNYIYSINTHLLSTYSFNVFCILKQDYFVSKVLETFKMQDMQIVLVAVTALRFEQ